MYIRRGSFPLIYHIQLKNYFVTEVLDDIISERHLILVNLIIISLINRMKDITNA